MKIKLNVLLMLLLLSLNSCWDETQEEEKGYCSSWVIDNSKLTVIVKNSLNDSYIASANVTIEDVLLTWKSKDPVTKTTNSNGVAVFDEFFYRGDGAKTTAKSDIDITVTKTSFKTATGVATLNLSLVNETEGECFVHNLAGEVTYTIYLTPE